MPYGDDKARNLRYRCDYARVILQVQTRRDLVCWLDGCVITSGAGHPIYVAHAKGMDAEVLRAPLVVRKVLVGSSAWWVRLGAGVLAYELIDEAPEGSVLTAGGLANNVPRSVIVLIDAAMSAS